MERKIWSSAHFHIMATVLGVAKLVTLLYGDFNFSGYLEVIQFTSNPNVSEVIPGHTVIKRWSDF